MDCLVFDAITPETAREFVETLAKAPPAEPITIRVNSPGGDLAAALAMVSALQRRPGALVAIEGLAASAATLLCCVARTVASSSAMVMIHAPWTAATGNAGALREMADTLDAWSGQIIALYRAKTRKSEGAIRRLLSGGDQWLTAQEAREMGLVDAINDAPPVLARLGALAMPRAAAAQHAADLLAVARFRADPALRAEFPDYPTFVAWQKNAARIQGIPS